MKVLKFLKSVGEDLLIVLLGILIVAVGITISLGALCLLTLGLIILLDNVLVCQVVVIIGIGLMILFAIISVVFDLVKYLKKKWNEVQ